MIYTIGYQRNLTVEQLKQIVQDKGVDFLVDVRSKPYGRAYQFNKSALEKALGSKYHYAGNILGGFAAIADESIKRLADESQGKTLLLLCYEEDPCECHRHYEIARRLLPHGIDAVHLYRGSEKKESQMTQNALFA